MEALTALSVARSVIAFVNFGGKLVSNTRKLYRSANGMLSSAIDVEVLTMYLMTILHGLRRQLPEYRILSDSTSSNGWKRSLEDEALDDLYVRCVSIVQTLLDRLGRLKVEPRKESEEVGEPTTGRLKGLEVELPDDPATVQDPHGGNMLSKLRHKSTRAITGFDGTAADERPESRRFRKWDSFRKALESVWSKHEIDELAATLQDFRSEIEFRILVSFRYFSPFPLPFVSFPIYWLGLKYVQRIIERPRCPANRQVVTACSSTRLILDAFLTTRDPFSTELLVQAETLIKIQEAQNDWRVEAGRQKLERLTHGDLKPTGTLESPKGTNVSSIQASEIHPKDLGEPRRSHPQYTTRGLGTLVRPRNSSHIQ
ncbi:hypothetical protein JX265_002313 [Neoarthrinium moseri]|uniref:Uncharacterized protein n=1 Tax=Neoarthrinium moseri TaxID=1658444 RepID=A0A9Q0ASX0_9PEZI|nr:hypothetical protein JX266_000791 [Neoarthrinium moseri]KAI1879359.1 hypothetical protein JX265_002313 [Neoarthrinium moseri]